MAGGDRDALRLASLLQMTLPGAPCVYYGDEVGLEGGMDPGCRGAFPSDPARWDSGLRDVIKRAIAMRHEHAALRHGGFRVVGADGGALAYLRHDEDAVLVMALNAGERDVALRASLAEVAGRPLEPIFQTNGGANATRVDEGGAVTFALGRRSGVAFRAA
jgi:glycosidase